MIKRKTNLLSPALLLIVNSEGLARNDAKNTTDNKRGKSL